MPGTAPDTGETTVNKKTEILCLCGTYLLIQKRKSTSPGGK